MTGQRRSLPAWATDLVRDGLPAQALAREGHKAVYNALVKTACSAQQRGWSEVDWSYFLDEPGSELGRQNRCDAGRRPINPSIVRGRTNKAWAAAKQWLDDADSPWTADQASEHARALASTLRSSVIDGDLDLSDNERVLLAHVAEVAEARGSDRLTLPRAGLLQGSGLGLTALRTALARLADRGVLTLVSSGAVRTKGKPRRANVYQLTALSQSGNPVSGAPGQLAVPPGSVPLAVSGAPSTSQEPEGSSMTKMPEIPSMTVEEQAAVLRLLGDMRARAAEEQSLAAQDRRLRLVDRPRTADG